jgi:ribosomal protein S21
MIRIEIKKGNNDSNANILRRFTKRVQSSGVVREAKGNRYNTRTQSDYKKHKSAMKRMEKRTTMDRLRKLGKIKDVVYYRKAK